MHQTLVWGVSNVNILVVKGEVINRNTVQKKRKKIIQTINTLVPDTIKNLMLRKLSSPKKVEKLPLRVRYSDSHHIRCWGVCEVIRKGRQN